MTVYLTKAVRRPRLLIVFVLIILFWSAGSAYAEGQYIRIVSFNIANLGDTDEYRRSLVSLANFIIESDADLLCIQEVEPNELGCEQVERLVSLLNIAADYYGTSEYSCEISDEYTGDETIAFAWREPVMIQSGIDLLPHEKDPDNDGIRTFQRTPGMAYFRAGNYDFYVVNCHLYTKLEGVSSEGRGAEYDALSGWLKDMKTTGYNGDNDALILGDFNRFLNGKEDWDRLMICNHADYFRFPLLEAIEKKYPTFDPMTDDAPDDTCSTTTSYKKSIYDQVLISEGSYAEFTDSPDLDCDVGIVAFDCEECFKWCSDSWFDVTKFLSDHRPVWIKMRTDLPDDD